MYKKLEQILKTSGFKVVKFYDRQGGDFDPEVSFSALVIAESIE